MEYEHPKILLFDFDGVLVDSFEVGYQAAKKVGSPLSRDQEKKLFEGNVYESIKKLNLTVSTKNEEAYYAEYIAGLMKLTPVTGMPQIIQEFRKMYQLVVVTSSLSSPTRGYLRMHNVERYFDWIMGGDVHQSKAEKIKMVFAEYGVGAADCVFITDTLGDMREAAKCKVQSIGVTWGFHERDRLEKGKPFMVVDRVEELPGAVEAFFTEKEKPNNP